MNKRIALTAAAASAGLILAACSSAGAPNAGTSSQAAGASSAVSAAASGPAPTGAPIVIYDISDTTGIPGFDPSLFKGEIAAVQYINSNGGIGGRPLKLVTCDSKLDPGASSACGQAAVAAKAVAVVGIDNVAISGLDDIMSKAGIPALQVPTEPQQFSDPNYFPLGAGGAAEFLGIGYYLANTVRAKNISMIVQDAAFGHTFAQQVTEAAKAAGASNVRVTYYPPDTSDFSSVATQAAANHPDAVMTVINGSQIPVVYGLLEQQGVPADHIFNQSGALNSQVYKAAGQQAVNTYVSDEFANPDDTSNPDVQIYRNAMQAAGEGSYIDAFFGEWGFANMMFLDTIGKAIGGDQMTSAGVKSYLTKALAPGSTTTIPVFLASPLGPAPVKYPSVHRGSLQELQWDGTRFVTKSSMFTPPELAP